MAIGCCRYDQDLLLDAHGELPATRSFLLKLHLRSCKKCRARRQEFLSVSDLFAYGLGDHQPASAGQPVKGSRGSRPVRTHRSLVLLALLLAVFASAWGLRTVYGPHDQTPAVSVNPKPCDTHLAPGKEKHPRPLTAQ